MPEAWWFMSAMITFCPYLPMILLVAKTSFPGYLNLVPSSCADALSVTQRFLPHERAELRADVVLCKILINCYKILRKRFCQLLVDGRPIVGRKSTDCRPTIGRPFGRWVLKYTWSANSSQAGGQTIPTSIQVENLARVGLSWEYQPY